MTEEVHGRESARLADAHSRAADRLRRQRDALRPLGLAVIVVVAATASPGLHGRSLGVTLALCVFAAVLLRAIGRRFVERHIAVQVVAIGTMGAAGVALAALRPHGAAELAAGVAVWMAMARLPLALGVAVAVAVTTALDVALALAGSSSDAVLAATLVFAVMGLAASFLRQARASQDRTELLLAQLEDAREEQLRAAAVTERGRIATELHDVLAHSLSGAAIQLQGARKLAERDGAGADVRAAIDRAGELVKDGLANARQAVGALRGELPNVAQLDSLVAGFRDDTKSDVTLTIEGSVRPLPADASLALYRGAQEALTNVARYAPDAVTSVVLRYDDGRTTLIVEDRVSHATDGGLTGVGGGRGLDGLRERLERAGGSMHAGPTETGWRVELDVPA